MNTTHWLSRNAGRLAIVLGVLALLAWVLTGEPEPADEGKAARSPTVTVGLTTSRAEPVERVIVAQGHVEPEQVVRVRARTDGAVAETLADEGKAVTAGQPIVRLAMDDRQARLREARAAQRQAQSDYDAADRLADQGFQARLAAERALAALEASRARVAAIELDIERTRIETPIDGILDRQIARQGDFISVGDPVAEIVENDPLRAVVRIPQHRVREVAEGQTARVTFLDGETREGTVRYVSVTADQETRTFLARVSVANPDRDLPAGTSVTVEIPVQEVRAHAISPALIAQDEDGRLGVKVAEPDGEGGLRARFVPIEPVRANAERVWVTGLPDEARLISTGQGFVRDGDAVREGRAEDGAP